VTYQSEVLADSPAFYWELAETSGSTAADSSGNGHAGTHTNSPTVGSSLLGDGSGASRSYNGSNQYTTVAYGSWMNIANPTCEVRIKPDASALTGQQFIASRWVGATGGNVWLWSLNGGKVELTIVASGVTYTVTGSTTLTAGTTYTLAWTYDGNFVRVYVNGVLDGTSADTVGRTLTAPTSIAIEAARAAFAVYGHVNIAHLSLTPTVLSASRLLARHNAATSSSSPVSLSPPTSHASAAAIAPLIALVLAAPTAHATAEATAPTIQVAAVVLTPPTAHATADAAAPTVGLGAVNLSPPTAHATATGTAPAVSLSAVALNPPTATATAAATTPSLTVGAISLAPPTAHAAAAGVAPTVTVRTVPAPWTADLSQRSLLLIESAVTSATWVPPLAAIPPNIVEHPIRRESVIMPDPTTLPPESVRQDPDKPGQLVVLAPVYDALPRVTGSVGVPHIIIDGRDVTYFRDSRTLVREDTASEPFGDQSLVVEFPQITTLDDPDDPAYDLAWLRNDAPVHYVMQRWDETGPTGQIDTLFHGRLVSDDSGNDQRTAQTVWQARGTMYAAASFPWQVRPILNPVDLGTQIPKALNAVTSRRYGKIPNVTTGIPTMTRGQSTDKVMEYVQGLLGEGWTDDGNQWTIAKRPGSMCSYEMRRKKTGVQWVLTNGLRGLEVDLSADSTQSRNVIWGRGQRPDGGVWMNKKYPDAGTTSPRYPYDNPATVMTIGSTDAGTDTGDGVSTWQRRAIALGFRGITVDGVFNANDADACRRLQAQFGILVDGVVGPQTWAETFDVGANGADPDSWVRLPLAWVPGTMPLRYRANGSVIGPDPEYDETITIVADDIEFPTGTTLSDGIKSAQQMIARENPVPLTGRLVLDHCDPREGSWTEIEPGDRVKLIGYKGRDVVLYIASRPRSLEDGRVTLEVSERPTDALTLAQIRLRDNAARPDPARRPGKPRQRPAIDPWDCESNAGHIERRAQYGGLWSATRMPMSELGRISRLDLRASVPTEFAFHLFARPVTSAQAIAWFGANPKSKSDPGQALKDVLDNQYGWIEGWGNSSGMLGYDAEPGNSALTGRAVEEGVDYYCPDGYMYLLIWTAASCYFEGDMRAAPPEA
jgi:hypothetical protein